VNISPRKDSHAVVASSGLDRCPDPVSLYAALTGHGARRDTMVFEQANGLGIMMDRAALRIECRGRDVILDALSANGRNLISAVARRMAEWLVEQNDDQLRLRFPPIDGVRPEDRLKAPSPFDVLRTLTSDLSRMSSVEARDHLCLGIIAYDHVDLFEDLPPAAGDPLDFPNFLFWVPESLVIFEPEKIPRAICATFIDPAAPDPRQTLGVGFARLADLVERCGRAPQLGKCACPAIQATKIQADLDDSAYGDLVLDLKEHIAAGDAYQIVASRTFSVGCPDPFAAFRILRDVDSSPYNFFVSGGDFQLFGVSPETSVRVFRDRGLNVELKPIAGTRPRGKSPDEDDRCEAELRLDPKELAEHMMLIDLARNDVARISEPGSRHVTQMMGIERYARVMHLVSTVRGKLRQGLDAIDALKACLNMGTLTGAPKIRATELLRKAERTKRGPYGGAIGWLAGDGTMDSAIVIRSALVMHGNAFVRAGAGIVQDSDPQAEADETRRKASVLLSVLAGSMS
jgi:anthranilate synthase component I